METNQKQQYQPGKDAQDAKQKPEEEPSEVTPGIPVVRTNTPRPLSFEAMLSQAGRTEGGQLDEAFHLPNFPSMAPVAPPLPEELGERGDEQATNAPEKSKSPHEEVRDFIWLFEYGLEMDPATINSPERLDGLALLYGPAVLKGYTIRLGSSPVDQRDGDARTIATIIPDSTPGAEVWGVLYRVPRRLNDRIGHEPSVLDIIHSASSPHGLFQKVSVVVHETYRDRDIACMTYALTDAARNQIPLLPIDQAPDTLFTQRLTALAKKQKLPDWYLGMRSNPQASAIPRSSSGYISTATALSQEMNTDPLPAVKDTQTITPSVADSLPETPLASETLLSSASIAAQPSERQSRLMIVFALYLLFVLIGVLTFAVLQALNMSGVMLSDSVAPLGVPWLVLVYGLLGGCISSISGLAHARSLYPPRFVILAWFARPFVGAVLAGVVFLVLTSGIFIINGQDSQHAAIFWLAGALAGLCEGKIFFRYK